MARLLICQFFSLLSTLTPTYLVPCMQTDELGNNLEDAIRDYRVFDDDPDHMSDTNNAVENVQDVVCICTVLCSIALSPLF